MKINENPNNTKTATVAARKAFYDWLAENIKIDGIEKIERDLNFDNDSGTSGGIRLFYKSHFPAIAGVKEGILLEAGFDTVSPNSTLTISSWAYDRAAENKRIGIVDNRAVDIKCYDHRYTFVEKLQTIATKFRKEQESGVETQNFMRQYYDIYSLLADGQVQEFLGTAPYLEHKKKRFPATDFVIPVGENQAFLLEDEKLRARYKVRYEATAALYYNGQPDFEGVMGRIRAFVAKM
ncbi:MAG: nucleotidyl transferase AbiEii/AbiGii toxin family protein [Mucilaginibacter sp.]|nr:nucleotidyl transferase AbiEii/AbiGii toxin family protein [Mucilaginibacter sp.]